MLSSTAAAGTTMTFTVDNFRNPYSGTPRTGFIIYTADSSDGTIDSSSGNFAISITVSTWASFSSLTLSRIDGVTAVGQTSEIDILMTLSLPVDVGCRIKVYFPSDFAFDSNLGTVGLIGNIDGTGGSTISVSS